ncbi:helix-turn-helix transcriptional regulator [Neorhodopirellula pilleata]|uniref:Helix-turn-helix domain protein n=1 Tax=Neorhodopirellula pilleata TaxID=2714738 RepID=A0A5C5ZYC6_9BACT|nr:helix-turn-helix domain-containing protein [Neorhodopirellula pilleata]TWT92176.1 Helix-turn-helix domain protein [Neorhodopirellula pilleata]
MSKTAPHADAIQDGRGRAMLSVDDVAELYLNCSGRHVRRLVDAGRMPKPIRLGSLVRFLRSDIEQWLADGCPNIRNNAKGGKR